MLRLGSWGWPATRRRGNLRRAWVQRGSAGGKTLFLYGDTPSCYLEAGEKQPRRGSGHSDLRENKMNISESKEKCHL